MLTHEVQVHDILLFASFRIVDQDENHNALTITLIKCPRRTKEINITD